MKIKILLMLVISFITTMFASAVEITGTISPGLRGSNNELLTTASQVEALTGEKGKAKLLAPTVHPSGIKRLPKVHYTFKAKVTRKGVIIYELWPVKTVEEMNQLIAKRDGKVSDLTTVVAPTVTPQPETVRRAIEVTQPAPAPEKVREPVVLTKEPIKVTTNAPTSPPFPANLAEEKASLPPAANAGPIILENTLLGTSPPPTEEEISAETSKAQTPPIVPTGAQEAPVEKTELEEQFEQERLRMQTVLAVNDTMAGTDGKAMREFEASEVIRKQKEEEARQSLLIAKLPLFSPLMKWLLGAFLLILLSIGFVIWFSKQRELEIEELKELNKKKNHIPVVNPHMTQAIPPSSAHDLAPGERPTVVTMVNGRAHLSHGPLPPPREKVEVEKVLEIEEGEAVKIELQPIPHEEPKNTKQVTRNTKFTQTGAMPKGRRRDKRSSSATPASY